MIISQPVIAGGWGGARNSADRTSHGLNERMARRLIAACKKAVEIGLPLNRHVTVHWGKFDIPDSQVIQVIGKFVKLMSDWLRTKGQRAAWLWVREQGTSTKGSHVHILLHCPSNIPLGRMWRRWLSKVSGKPYRKGAVHTSRIGGTLNCYKTSPDRYRVNLQNVMGYLLKGADDETAKAIGLQRIEYTGGIIGKRASVAQCLAG
ncbi:hypothetical protein ACFOWX_00405 [Sphingorhabdus arenilitoris]|uniref:Inovirus Gp2 family protein n=1 Tax=Sphingorhabdus arenilitoris TaxID=1490041 RepID=A0ABV8RF53_9SPHN